MQVRWLPSAGGRCSSGGHGTPVRISTTPRRRLRTRRQHSTGRTALASGWLGSLKRGAGAGLVLFGLVADDDSVARAVVMCMHLLNTLFLLGALALTGWWADRPGKLSFGDGPTVGIGLGFAGLFLVGVSGAIAALGDTLFPSASLIEGFYADLDPSSHFLIRLRGYHPVLAIAVTVGLFSLAKRLRAAPPTNHLATALMVLLGAQLAIGFINLGLLAPVPLQLIHLLMADIVWVVFVLLSATTLNRVAS